MYTRLYRNGTSLPSAGVRESSCLVRCEMFFLRMHPERTSTTSVYTSKPFTGFVGALDGSDTSRTQVALTDCVNSARPCGAFDPPPPDLGQIFGQKGALWRHSKSCQYFEARFCLHEECTSAIFLEPTQPPPPKIKIRFRFRRHKHWS